ncbi:hypothetical protein [Thalassoglobus sp.]|uniref:hypothetical protein n=1 Tax=Thalassoglobus sp. TaxID=2795869 RepID=UPI003AA8488C
MPIAFKCSCGKVYKVPDDAAGKKFKCKACEKPLQVPAPGARKAKKKVPAEHDPFSMDFGLEDDAAPAALPPRRKKGGESSPKKKKSGASPKTESKKGLYIGIGVVAFLVVGGVGGFFAVQSMGDRAPAAPVQVQYSTFKHELGGFSVKYPSDWEMKEGGGSGGRPPFASFEDGTAYISIRHNPKGASIGSMASLPSGGPIIPGEQVEEDPPAKSVHEFMAETVYSIDFKDFEELPGKEFKVPYGVGWLSEFTGTEGFGSKKKAYRLTLTGTNFQYNVICKCPSHKWDDYEAIFMEVIKSIGR